MINFQIYKTHIKPPKPALIKPIKPAGLGFMIKPWFYANPDWGSGHLKVNELLTSVLESHDLLTHYQTKVLNP